MPDNGVKYDGNGEDLHNYGDHSSSQPRGRSHGGPDDYIDSKSRHGSRDYGREPSKNSDKERDKVQDKERERDRGRDRNRDYDRHSRDRYMDRGDRRVRGKYSDDYHRSRDFERRRDYDRDREDRHRRKSRSRSPSRSRSRSKSKRTSGFDMAPSTSAMLGGASFVAADGNFGLLAPLC